MTIIEAIAAYLAPAIAKAILKQWMKESPTAEGAGSALIDIIKSKTTDFFAQARARRQFEAIGEKVAENLLEIINIEWASVPENGRVAAIQTAGETLNKTDIKAELLLEHNLDPKILADYFLASNPSATNLFSSAETELYKRIIHDSSQYIVDIASQLPQFNERTFAEVLKKENQILDVAHQVLAEVQRIRKSSDQIDLEVARFEGDYRLAVLRNLDYLQLFGADLSPASARHRLSVAYVTLSVRQGSNAEETDLSEVEQPPEGQSKNDPGSPVSVNEVLAETNRLIVLGEAGSGKTTLLQWVAVRSAQKDFKGGLVDWNETIPFFIRLRQCSETGLPAPEDFPKFVSTVIAGSMPHGWVHEQLRSGRAVVLIDGLDELGQAMRDEVRDWLRELMNSYERVRFVVSSRPYAIEEGWMEAEGFVNAELLPMELPDINNFIDQWHEAVLEQLQEEEARAKMKPLAENLKLTMLRESQKRKLATNPLLCAMLCALNRDRQEQLPSDRIELYEACIHMLVERRDIERKVDLRDYPALGYRQKLSLLQDMAYWLIKNNYSMVLLPKVEERLNQKLAVMDNLGDGVSGQSVLKLFIERSGILREPVKDNIDFTHRTFQEFLAAKALLNEGDFGLLVNHAHEEQWREVVILAAGLARTNEREELINGLLERGDSDASLRHQLYLLAVACLETSVELNRGIRQKLIQRLTELIPPKKMGEAKLLASAGDLAIAYLSKRGRYYSTQAAACIRTLSLIGGEEALAAIETYASDGRLAVENEIMRAWDSFDRAEYAKRILRNRTGLFLNRTSTLEGFQHLPQLTQLSIDNLWQVEDFSPLTYLVNLTYLSLTGSWRLADLGMIENLTQLETLGISTFNSLKDISAIGNLTNLSRLTMSTINNIEDLTPIAKLINLMQLNLFFMPAQDLNFISGLTNLKELLIVRCFSVKDISALATCNNLQLIIINNCPLIKDLRPLSSLNQIRTIQIIKDPNATLLVPEELQDKVSIIEDPRLKFYTSDNSEDIAF
ncbi:MAG TPA: NACHT domain-containing protein [Pyrinomonadaceae bacterium]|nr:NACHT domain-containing protein [Pyrinomonadaceae bacterium]